MPQASNGSFKSFITLKAKKTRLKLKRVKERTIKKPPRFGGMKTYNWEGVNPDGYFLDKLEPIPSALPSFQIAFDADPKFFACLVRFESSSVPTTLPTAYDVYPLDGRHDGGYDTVKDCVTIDVLPRTPGNNVYVGFMVWSNFTATKCRGLVSLNQVIKEIICLQPLK